MRWLLRKSSQAALVGDISCNSSGLSKLGFNGVRRSVVTSCRGVLLPRFGEADVLELRDNVSVPDLKPNEVLVRARAVSVNPLDCRMREGYGRSLFEPLLPLILGRDISGEVAAVGSSVSSLSVGQEVFGALHPTAVRGTYVDYAILAEDELISKPESMSHVEASAVPFAALTAWRALRSTANIKKGQRILVVGGGGAVGFSAIQLAVAAGCHVSTICGNECIDRILATGAEQTVDYTTENYESSIKGYFDAVLDTIGAPETERIAVGHLKRGGHYMTLQGEAASISDKYGMLVGLPRVNSAFNQEANAVPIFSWNSAEYHWTYMRADAEGLEEIRRLCEGGKLKVPVEKTYPITQVRAAHEAKDKKLIYGKIVLELD